LDALVTVRPVLGLGLALLVAMPALVDSVRLDVMLTRVGTRRLARDWGEANLPQGAHRVVDSAPPGPALSRPPPTVLVANDFALFDVSPEEYAARGIGYVVTSSFSSEARAVDPARDARRRIFYADLGRYARLAEFRPFSGSQAPAFVYDRIYAPFDA